MIYKPQPLIKTNPHLHDPQKRQAQFVTAVMTSTGVEGVSISSSELRKPLKKQVKRK